MEQISENWHLLQERIAKAAQNAGRNPDAIKVMAVSKTRPVAEIETALACGLNIFGENRVQEAETKIGALPPATWHLIGRLQTNKAGKAAALFDTVQSLDSLKLAQALQRRAVELDRHLDVFVQVNTSDAPHQGGMAPEQTPDLVEALEDMSHLRLRGLMTIGAHGGDEIQIRTCFASLRRLGQQLDPSGTRITDLSMGMSGDFEWAIAEGATLLRLGTVLFGARPS
jgi:PLP dependent protein